MEVAKMAEEKLTWYDKVSDSWNAAVDNAKKTVDDLFDRVAGKESSISIDLEDVGLDLGEGRKYTATGSVKLSLSMLK